MKKTIYYMYKPGDARDYAMTTPPSVAWAAAMAVQGFKLFECLVDIPTDIPLAGYGDEAAPAEEVPLVPATKRGLDCIQWLCRDCGATLGQSHTHGCPGSDVLA